MRKNYNSYEYYRRSILERERERENYILLYDSRSDKPIMTQGQSDGSWNTESQVNVDESSGSRGNPIVIDSGSRENPIVIDEGTGSRENPIVIDEGTGSRENPIVIDEGTGERGNPIVAEKDSGSRENPIVIDDEPVSHSR